MAARCTGPGRRSTRAGTAALSYGYAKHVEKQLKRAVRQLSKLAKPADAAGLRQWDVDSGGSRAPTEDPREQGTVCAAKINAQPVFGTIKSVTGRFSVRGLDQSKGR